MTRNSSDDVQRRIIPYAVFTTILMAGFTWLFLQRPALRTMILAVVILGLLELVGGLWLIGPERRRKLLPLESVRQAISRKWVCAGCGATHSAQVFRCEQCGALNPTKIWQCPICEASVTKDLGICPECGTAKPLPD